MRVPLEDVELILDLNGREVVILYSLASLGVAAMSRDLRTVSRIMDMLNDQDDGEEVAKAALEKFYAGIQLMKANAKESA
jgi:hypothetical protein